MDPRTEFEVANLKLVWWREEMGRLAAGSPVHPVTRYLADLPRAAEAVFAPLARSVDCAAAQVAGAPLERSVDLESHADGLYGAPLLVAACLAGVGPQAAGARASISALAAGQYLARIVRHYRGDARIGRVPFAVDELLAEGIDNDDLLAEEPSPRLVTHLTRLRGRAAACFSTAAAALGAGERPPLRHLTVLAALGAKHLNDRPRRSGADFRVGDLYNAWQAARRAANAR
jgi:phytoene synthase